MKDSDPFRELLRQLQEGELELGTDVEGGNSGGSPPGTGGQVQRPQGRGFLWILLPILVLILFSRSLGFITDWLWYSSLDLSAVLLTRIWASAGLFVISGLLFWLFLAGNVLLARRLEPNGLLGTPLNQIADAVGIRITPVVLIGAAVIAFFVASGTSSLWEEVLLFLNQANFGLTDPIFGRDVSFFLFTVPIWQAARNYLLTTLIFTLIATALVTGLGWRSWNARTGVRAHLSILGALILLLIAWQYRLEAYQLVFSARGAVFGGGYTDVRAQLPAYNILTVVTLITSGLLIINVFLRSAWRAILVVLGLWAVVAVLAGNVYPGLVQRFQVAPNEFTREEPYIRQNIDFTRVAFGLDDLQEQDYNAEGTLTAAGLLEQPETVHNIRLWDYRPLLQTYNQVQALRQQYQFSDIDIDRYTIDGERRQLMLAARELIPDQLELPAQTWVNRKLIYTHGYGVAASPVAEITPDGLPTFVLKDLPTQGVLEVTRPQIYFGERTDEYVIVKTDTEEFDYPRGEGGNALTTFDENTGVPIGGFLPRLAFAMRFADMNMLISQELRPESQLLWRRNIRERTQEVAPFLHYDSDPYIVVGEDGRLYWFLDAYTTSGRFPYSEPSRSGTKQMAPGFNYIRNPVKVIVDAYSGTMTFYLVEPNEPIAAAYSRIFPDLFTSYDQMPAHLKAHIRYPNDLFSIQASVLTTYQMTDPIDFYNREDMWAWPEEIFDDTAQPMEPYYVLMQLPNEQDLDFIQILPFTPANRENMIAWLAAHNDPEKYGQKILYRFGKDSLIFGPKQIEARIDQDPVISSQLSLWNQQGSQVIRGNLLVIPIGEGLLYVEPLYLQAASGKIPELKRVILATSGRVIMAENLGLALVQLFGGDVLSDERLRDLAGSVDINRIQELATQPASATGGGSLEELILEASQRYDQAQTYLQAGDWSGYGAEMDALKSLLQQLVERAGIAPIPDETNGSE